MNVLVRSVLTGVAYGLAVTAVDLGGAAWGSIQMAMPATLGATATAGVAEVILGAVLGLATAPVRLLLGRALYQLLAVAAVWTLLAATVAVDPADTGTWLMPPAAGLVVLGVGHLVWRRWPRAAWTAAVTVVVAAILTPTVVTGLRAGGRSSGPPPVAAAAGAPDVIVIVLDTVRAASMSAYGYHRPTTPTFDELSTEGALYLDATSPSTWSLPSHASLFTGWFPSAARAHREHRVLGRGLPTLAEVFHRNGYETLCFTANPHISDGLGLTRGFMWSDRAYLSGLAGRSFTFIYRVLDLLGVSASDKGGGEVAGNFERWVADRDREGPPVFAFLNFLEAHFPYHQVPAGFLAEFTDRSPHDLRRFSLETFGAQFGRRLTTEEALAAVRPTTDMYDAGVLYSDHLLARVVSALREAGTLDETVLVVLADHGELLGEHHVFGHGQSLHQPDLHVPLFIRYPSRIDGGTRVESPVSTVGVYASVLELAGIEPPGPLHVGSLLPDSDTTTAGGRPVIAERFRTPRAPVAAGAPLASNLRYRVYRSGDWKLVEDETGARFLFDLDADPGETNDLAASAPQRLATLQEELAVWAERLGLPALDAEVEAGAEPELDAATRERLESLGYVE